MHGAAGSSRWYALFLISPSRLPLLLRDAYSICARRASRDCSRRTCIEFLNAGNHCWISTSPSRCMHWWIACISPGCVSAWGHRRNLLSRSRGGHL
jgi:hypothetical protein